LIALPLAYSFFEPKGKNGRMNTKNCWYGGGKFLKNLPQTEL
jgi:hypothetical protein